MFSSPTSRGWCSSSTLAPSDESPPHTEVVTISEPAASQTDTHERATDGLTPASRTEDDSFTTTTPAFLEVDFDVADTNYIRVTGNVGLDPQLRETAKGNSVTNLHMYVFQGKNNDAARYAFKPSAAHPLSLSLWCGNSPNTTHCYHLPLPLATCGKAAMQASIIMVCDRQHHSACFGWVVA